MENLGRPPLDVAAYKAERKGLHLWASEVYAEYPDEVLVFTLTDSERDAQTVAVRIPFHHYFFMRVPDHFTPAEILPFKDHVLKKKKSDMKIELGKYIALDQHKTEISAMKIYTGESCAAWKYVSWFKNPTDISDYKHTLRMERYGDEYWFEIYEGTIDMCIRFMVDTQIHGGGWFHVAPKRYSVVTKQEDRLTDCQLEIKLFATKDATADPGCRKIPMFRIASFDFEAYDKLRTFPRGSNPNSTVFAIGNVLQFDNPSRKDKEIVLTTMDRLRTQLEEKKAREQGDVAILTQRPLRPMSKAQFLKSEYPKFESSGMSEEQAWKWFKDQCGFTREQFEQQYEQAGHPKPSEAQWQERAWKMIQAATRNMYHNWTTLVKTFDPDIIMGYNSDDFDFRMAYDEAVKLGLLTKDEETGEYSKTPMVANQVHPFGCFSRLRNFVCQGKESTFTSSATGAVQKFGLRIPGRLNFDILREMPEFKFPQNNLDYVAEKLLKQRKFEMSAQKLMDTFEFGTAEEKLAVLLYCAQDCRLPKRIFEKLKLAPKYIGFARKTGLNTRDIWEGGQQKRIYQRLLRICQDVAPERGHRVLVPSRAKGMKFRGDRPDPKAVEMTGFWECGIDEKRDISKMTLEEKKACVADGEAIQWDFHWDIDEEADVKLREEAEQDLNFDHLKDPVLRLREEARARATCRLILAPDDKKRAFPFRYKKLPGMSPEDYMAQSQKLALLTQKAQASAKAQHKRFTKLKNEVKRAKGYAGAIQLDPKRGLYMAKDVLPRNYAQLAEEERKKAAEEKRRPTLNKDNVVVITKDFGSLYPSECICYNASWDTFLTDDDIKKHGYTRREYKRAVFDEKTQEFVRPEVKGDYHEFHVRPGEPPHRFLARPSETPRGQTGILPLLLQDLLGARKAVKKEMDMHTKSAKQLEIEIKNLQVRIDALKKQALADELKLQQLEERHEMCTDDDREDGDLRAQLEAEIKSLRTKADDLWQEVSILNGEQNALKIVANSAYGATGAGNKGKIPHLPTAETITHTGVRQLLETRDAILLLTDGNHGFPLGDVLYGDTDSTMTAIEIPDSIRAPHNSFKWAMQDLLDDVTTVKCLSKPSADRKQFADWFLSHVDVAWLDQLMPPSEDRLEKVRLGMPQTLEDLSKASSARFFLLVHKMANKVGKELAAKCTRMYAPPHTLNFECYYLSFNLFSRKRYAGEEFKPVEDEKDYANIEGHLKTKGASGVRRDFCSYAHDIWNAMTHTIYILRDVKLAVQQFRQYVQALLNGTVETRRLELTCKLAAKYAGGGKNLRQVHVANKMESRAIGSAPPPGSRISFVMTVPSIMPERKGKGKAPKPPAYTMAEDIVFAIENDVPINGPWYLEHQIKAPFLELFTWTLHGHKVPPDADSKSKEFKALEAETEALLFHGHKIVVRQYIAPEDAKKGIMAFTKTMRKCLVCKAAINTGEEKIHEECRPLVKETLQSVGKRYVDANDRERKIWLTCYDCPAASKSAEKARQCSNFGCQNLTRRKVIDKEVTGLRQQITDLSIEINKPPVRKRPHIKIELEKEDDEKKPKTPPPAKPKEPVAPVFKQAKPVRKRKSRSKKTNDEGGKMKQQKLSFSKVDYKKLEKPGAESVGKMTQQGAIDTIAKTIEFTPASTDKKCLITTLDRLPPGYAYTLLGEIYACRSITNLDKSLEAALDEGNARMIMFAAVRDAISAAVIKQGGNCALGVKVHVNFYGHPSAYRFYITAEAALIYNSPEGSEPGLSVSPSAPAVPREPFPAVPSLHASSWRTGVMTNGGRLQPSFKDDSAWDE